MKIAHVSDLHIRNFKYRNEYRSAFLDLYGKLYALKPDLIINTGDLVHSKLAVSPELFDDVADHMLAMTDIAPYWLILGNHDLNLKNMARTDAISPIVRALQGRTKHELRMLKDGIQERMLERAFPHFAFHCYDIRNPNQKYIPCIDDINIGLYHGSISGCVTDQGFVIEDGESEVDRFRWMDYVMLGDIHKRQSFRNGRMQYPGSLIQQNYGEELVKGFLLWDIKGKDDFQVDFHPVEAPGRFFTVQVPQDLDLSKIVVPKGSRIKALVDGGLSPSRRMKLESMLSDSFSPIEVIIPDVADDTVKSEPIDIDELIGSREKVMREHLSLMNLKSAEIDSTVKLFKQYEALLDSDSTNRGTSWQLRKISWDNMMNYGEGSSIDFTKVSGLIGIFGPNAIGKSSIFDILLQSLFDKVSKEVPRNIDLVNDNKDCGSMVVNLDAGGRPYVIERSIERIHYGQRKLSETKQWGKTTLDFTSGDDSLNGTTRPETEKAIRSIIGNFEDFVLTAMVSQNPIFGLPGGADILNCRETDRRKILFRFLDLDVYERIAAIAKDDLKSLMGKLRELDRDSLNRQLEGLSNEHDASEKKVQDIRNSIRELELAEKKIASGLEAAGASSLQPLALERKNLSEKRSQQVNRLATLQQDAQRYLKSADSLYQSRLELLSSQPAEGPIPLEELQLMISRLRKQREHAVTELSSAQQRLKQGMKSLATLDGIPCEGKYPSCKFISEASSFLGQRSEIEEAIRNLIGKAEGNSTELVSLEKYEIIHRDFNLWKQRLAKIELDISRLEKDENVLKFEIKNVETELTLTSIRIAELDLMLHPSALDEIKRLKGEQMQVSKTRRSWEELLDRDLRSIGALESKVERVKADILSLDGLAEKAACYERLIQMCGKDGLPYRILSLVLPVINSEISKILNGIVKFNVFFEADPEEQTVSLFIQYGDYKSRPLSLGSGAEKFISALAIRVALLSVSSLPKTDILIIDEGFGRLDPEHLEALQKMFEYLRNAFGSVFIVSHVDSMRDIVDHSIEITSQDGYAHVEVA